MKSRYLARRHARPLEHGTTVQFAFFAFLHLSQLSDDVVIRCGEQAFWYLAGNGNNIVRRIN